MLFFITEQRIKLPLTRYFLKATRSTSAVHSGATVHQFSHQRSYLRERQCEESILHSETNFDSTGDMQKKLIREYNKNIIHKPTNKLRKTKQNDKRIPTSLSIKMISLMITNRSIDNSAKHLSISFARVKVSKNLEHKCNFAVWSSESWGRNWSTLENISINEYEEDILNKKEWLRANLYFE